MKVIISGTKSNAEKANQTKLFRQHLITLDNNIKFAILKSLEEYEHITVFAMELTTELLDSHDAENLPLVTALLKKVNVITNTKNSELQKLGFPEQCNFSNFIISLL